MLAAWYATKAMLMFVWSLGFLSVAVGCGVVCALVLRHMFDWRWPLSLLAGGGVHVALYVAKAILTFVWSVGWLSFGAAIACVALFY